MLYEFSVPPGNRDINTRNQSNTGTPVMEDNERLCRRYDGFVWFDPKKWIKTTNPCGDLSQYQEKWNSSFWKETNFTLGN